MWMMFLIPFLENTTGKWVHIVGGGAHLPQLNHEAGCAQRERALFLVLSVLSIREAMNSAK